MQDTANLKTLTESVSDEQDVSSFRSEVLNDYHICCLSREASVLARKEVLTGKGKFGITGDGKEVAQVALAKALRKGDWRSGYYRDQTLLLALGAMTIEEYFAQLYADSIHDPFSHGRQMMTHFASPLVDRDGLWRDHLQQFNISSDVSCTAGQMGRAVGLALASKKYKDLDVEETHFSDGGNEVVLCTIGDGSTSEGSFWEAVNASCVMQIPVGFCIWDDGYAISVPTHLQTTKGSISKALSGMLVEENLNGMRIYVGKGWDYAGLCEMFAQGFYKIRNTQTPALFHVQEMTQPLGHSTSGSHERYKPGSRILWEREMDCILAFGAWIVHHELADYETLQNIRESAKEQAREGRRTAWSKYAKPVLRDRDILKKILYGRESNTSNMQSHIEHLSGLINPTTSEILAIARAAYYDLHKSDQSVRALSNFIDVQQQELDRRYEKHLYSEGELAAINVEPLEAVYNDDSPLLNGYEILNRYFESAFAKHEKLLAFGEDVGKLGDVNQGMMGMQAKFGEERVFDTGIREWTIIGQAIGLAMRGFRPIAEIQYLDYLAYAMAPLTDDLATLSYRSNGIQKAPAIVRTRGHRLEGIWHTGSPMGMLLHSLRGIYILVPRNMVQAAGMYETMLHSTDPCLIIECLNGYRQKEQLPDNLGEYRVPIGMAEVLEPGNDLTLVTYGACVRISAKAVTRLKDYGISVELIDIQCLIPLDRTDVIFTSLKKTNRLLIVDEDVPGGASAYILQQVVEERGGFDYLEISARTLTAKNHRTPYGSDGDYFAKPNVEDVVEVAYEMMRECDPQSFPLLSLS